jgi:hypothetical protein
MPVSDPNASTWVDRGDPPEPSLARVLAFYLHRDLRAEATTLHEWATEVLGMVDANATDVNLGGYLAALADGPGVRERTSFERRAAGIALWHVAKCALIRPAGPAGS